MFSRHEEHLHAELVKLGCPAPAARRMVREMADHREDLKKAAVDSGLSAVEAEQQAESRLGEPVVLAQQLTQSWRQSAWYGRHPMVAFGLAPLLLAPFVSLLGILLAVSAWWSPVEPHTQHLQALGIAMKFVCWGCAAGPPLLLCWLARRRALPEKWLLLACLVCSLHGWLSVVTVTPQHLIYGYWWWSRNWVGALIPLLIGLVFLFRRPHRKNSLMQIQTV